MEGYTNIMGGQYDFDDLDIEGRAVDEWNTEDEKNNLAKFKGSKPLDEQELLSQRVKLDNGKQANVFSFSKKNDNLWYTCHVCSDTVAGLSWLRDHMESRKHRVNMNKDIHPWAKFAKLDPTENFAIEPGEPVPPGLEEVIIKSCQIQPRLDAYKEPLIGLEFLVELTQSNFEEEVYYYCLLCDKTGRERNIFIHLTSLFHYMKYLATYYPTVAQKLHALPNKKLKRSFAHLVTEIVGDIEAKYGRMKPVSEKHSDFNAPGRKAELQTLINEGPHFRESENEKFDEKATAENVDRKMKERQILPVATINEDNDKTEEIKESTGSIFNKINRINVDKKQLRSRDEDKANSPDIEITDIQLPKYPERKKRSRSKSLSSISTITSSSSKSRTRYSSRHSLKLSGPSRSLRRLSRSRSRSPVSRRHRRSPSYSRKYSPVHQYRDRSPPRKYNYNRRDSRGRSPDSYKSSRQYNQVDVDRYGRSRDRGNTRSDNQQRDKDPYRYRRSRDRSRSRSDIQRKEKEAKELPREFTSSEERIRWTKFREDLKKIETVKLEKLKYHEKNPEKHPQYPDEWKSFWNRRYNELQRSGVDPTKHDFKPEWISFWTKRMKDLYDEDLGKAKDELKKKFDLPEEPIASSVLERGSSWKHNQRKQGNISPGLTDISPPTPDKKDMIADIKTTWKALTGSDIKDNRKRSLSPWEEESSSSLKKDARKHSPKSRSQSPANINSKLLEDMPQRKSRTSSLIFVLRKLTVLEQQLGSLAPKVFELLSQSLGLEKIKEDASLDLLFKEENSVFLETVREKLIALLCAGVVPRNIVNTARSAIKNIDISLYLSSKRLRSLPVGSIRSSLSSPSMGMVPITQNVLPNQYVAQPKSEPVIVPGVGQVDKVAIAQQIAAALIEQGKNNVSEAELEHLINAVVGMAEASANSAQPMTTANFLQQLQSMQNTGVQNIPPTNFSITEVTAQAPQLSNDITMTTPISQPQSAFGALKLLQSAYNDPAKCEQDSPKPDVIEIVTSNESSISDKEMAATLALFNKTSKEDQPNFINKLKSTNPNMYKRLTPFIPSKIIAISNNSKRSPINIPIIKEKSEQKIKPFSSGRLSPFSSRSGGANPSIGEKVIVDDDDEDEDEKTGFKSVSQTTSKPPESHEMLKFKSNSDGDDDDDDYSFEDVYKAAHENLRQNQLNEDKKSNQSITKTEISTDSSIIKKEATINQPCEIIQTTNTTWNLNNQEKNILVVGENYHHQKQSIKGNSLQQSFQSNVNQLNTILSHTTQPDLNQSVDTSATYQKPMERSQQTKPYTDSIQPSYDDGSFQNYPSREQYSKESFYTETNTEFYDKSSHYTQDPPYSSLKETYNNPQREYSSSYRDSYNEPYNAQLHPDYENRMSSYDDEYSYREPSFGSENYSQTRPLDRLPYAGFHNTPSRPPRYPDSRYSHY